MLSISRVSSTSAEHGSGTSMYFTRETSSVRFSFGRILNGLRKQGQCLIRLFGRFLHLDKEVTRLSRVAVPLPTPESARCL